MASYLHQFQPYEIEPYRSPIPLYGQALQIKDARLLQNLNVIRSRYDAVLNTPLTNDEDRATLYKGVDDAMKKLGQVAANDISLPENVSQINSLFDNILKDDDIIYDAAWTRNHQSQLKKAEEMQKKDPNSVPPQNLDKLYEAQERFRTSKKGARPALTQFSPFYDFDKVMDEELDKVKADVDLIFSNSENKVEGPDGKMHSVSTPLQYTVEQLKEYKIRQLVSQRLANNPQALHQMSLDYDYNTKYGLYPPQAAIEQLGSEINTYDKLTQALSVAIAENVTLEQKPLTANDKTIYEERLKAAQEEATRLKNLKNKISINPGAANEYFTFNKFIRDYTESKVTQRTYKKDSLIQEVPGLIKATDYQLDTFLEGWKARFQMQKDAAKAELDAQAAVGTSAVPAPITDILSQLSSNPSGILLEGAEIAALHDTKADPATGEIRINWSGDSTTPDNSLIISPAEGSYTPEQQEVISGNIVLGKFYQELANLGYSNKMKPIPVIGSPAYVIPESREAPMTAKQVLDAYKETPEKFDKVKPILDKYEPLFKQVNLDINNQSSVERLTSAANSDAMKAAIKFGSTTTLNGNYQFIPNKDKNTIQSKNGKVYSVGRLIVPMSDLLNSGIDDDDFGELIRYWGTTESRVVGDKKNEGKVERAFSIPVYIPVTSDMIRANDRLLDAKDYQKQWGKDAPAMREASKKRVDDFGKLQKRASNLMGVDLPITGTPGDLRIDVPQLMQQGSSGSQSVQKINTIISEISLRTGQPYNKAMQDVLNVLSTVKDPLGRQAAFEQLGSTPYTPQVNPRAIQLWNDISSEFQVTNLGIMGDQAHRNRVSDHNTGNAQDIGIQSIEQGNQIVQKLVREASDRTIKYIIFNGQIWNPSISNEWRPYTGSDKHDKHIHVSFK